MTEQTLDQYQIRPGIEQMGGETMAKHMGRAWLIDPSLVAGFVKRPAHRFRIHRLGRIVTRE